MNDQKDVQLFITWDDALANGNVNEQNLARKGKELLEEVLKYRQLGSCDELKQVLNESEQVVDKAIKNAEDLLEYRKLGTVDDLRLILHMTKCLAQGMTMEAFLLNYIEGLKGSS